MEVSGTQHINSGLHDLKSWGNNSVSCGVQIAVTEDTHSYTRHQIEHEICRLIFGFQLMLHNVTHPKLLRKENVKHSDLQTNPSPFGTNSQLVKSLKTVSRQSNPCRKLVIH